MRTTRVCSCAPMVLLLVAAGFFSGAPEAHAAGRLAGRMAPDLVFQHPVQGGVGRSAGVRDARAAPLAELLAPGLSGLPAPHADGPIAPQALRGIGLARHHDHPQARGGRRVVPAAFPAVVLPRGHGPRWAHGRGLRRGSSSCGCPDRCRWPGDPHGAGGQRRHRAGAGSVAREPHSELACRKRSRALPRLPGSLCRRPASGGGAHTGIARRGPPRPACPSHPLGTLAQRGRASPRKGEALGRGLRGHPLGCGGRRRGPGPCTCSAAGSWPLSRGW